MTDNEYVLGFKTELLRELGCGAAFQGVLTDHEQVLDYLAVLLYHENLCYRERVEAEKDPEFKQLIPYIILARDGRFFNYQRTKKGGEGRLHDKWSLGIGGHINPKDGDTEDPFYEMGFCRELHEETGLLLKDIRQVRYSVMGLINDDSNDVGKVHFGVIHVLTAFDPNHIRPTDPAIAKGTWSTINELRERKLVFEPWSQLIIENLWA